MAMRIISSRLLSASNMPLRGCVAPCVASMSSKTPSASSSSNDIDKSGIKKRESLRSKFASVFGGKVQAADPNHPGFPAEEVNWPDTTEQATGEAKLFLLAFENGILDPYCNMPVVLENNGTKDNPIKVPSFTNERIVGCVCEPTQSYHKYMHLRMDEPKRCNCGYWMELVDAPHFWKKIPKEDLIQIPFFKDLDDDGKLDDILTGKVPAYIKDDHHHHH